MYDVFIVCVCVIVHECSPHALGSSPLTPPFLPSTRFCFEAGRCLGAHYSRLSEEQRGEMLSDGPLNCTFVLWKLETTLYDEVSGGVCEWHAEAHLKRCMHLTPYSTQVPGSD